MKIIFQLLLIGSSLFLLYSCKDGEEKQAGEDNAEHDSEAIKSFNNPLLKSGADPWVIERNGTYYYTHTTGNRLEVRATNNMEDLGNAEQLTIWKPAPGEEWSRHIWAPELHYLDGKWYMYFAATHDSKDKVILDENRRMYVLENTSDSPMNTNWEFKGKISDASDKWAIDGTVLEYNSNRYFIWSGWRGTDKENNSGRQQLYIAKMTNPWTLEGERVMISEPEHPWEKNGLVNEGPVVLKNKDGKAFLFYSASGCWTDEYKLGVLTLKENGDPLNPADWSKHPQPMFTKKPEHKAFGPGHNSFFKSPDGTEDWILYHANPETGQGCGGNRSPRIQKIGWDENGFPVLGEPADIDQPLEVPAGA